MKKILQFLFTALEHNPAHSVKIDVFGRRYHFCARCLGICTAVLLSLPVFLWLSLSYSFQMWPVLVFTSLMVSFSVLDYSTVELFQIRNGDNRVRIVLGGLLGIGAMSFLFLFPSSFWNRILILIGVDMFFLGFMLWVGARKSQLGFVEFTRRVIGLSVRDIKKTVYMYRVSPKMAMAGVPVAAIGDISCPCIPSVGCSGIVFVAIIVISMIMIKYIKTIGGIKK